MTEQGRCTLCGLPMNDHTTDDVILCTLVANASDVDDLRVRVARLREQSNVLRQLIDQLMPTDAGDGVDD